MTHHDNMSRLLGKAAAQHLTILDIKPHCGTNLCQACCKNQMANFGCSAMFGNKMDLLNPVQTNLTPLHFALRDVPLPSSRNGQIERRRIWSFNVGFGTRKYQPQLSTGLVVRGVWPVETGRNHETCIDMTLISHRDAEASAKTL